MTIALTDAGKKFNRDWIFRHINFSFETGKQYALTGPNGSGKSTLLQAIGSSMNLSEGKAQWFNAPNQLIDPEKVYQCISMAAPYLELIEEMTAQEFMHFHASFKTLQPALSIDEILEVIGLGKAAGKQIRYFSSGMKQRIKLAQAIFSDVPILLLDEPCTNLDAGGYELYHQLVTKYCSNKMVIVSSNDPHEYDFCETVLQLQDYK